jgi:hypothetical protein
MTTPYETLRAKVYEIIYPAGIQIEFGTEFKTKKFGEPYNFVYLVSYTEHTNFGVFFRVAGQNDTIHASEMTEILGKPLELRDLLRAIHKKQDGEDSNEYAVDMSGDLFRFIGGYDSTLDTEMVAEIDLTKPLSDQSEDTIKKLIELL